jgi:DNA primase
MISARLFGLEVTGTSAGEELVRCPFHSDGSASAWFNPKKGLFYCSVCNMGLNAKQLSGRLGLDESMLLDGEDGSEPDLPDFDLIPPPNLFNVGIYANNPYLSKRGIERSVSNAYDVRYIPTPHEAISFPIKNIRGNLTGVVYRFIDPKEAGTRYKVHGELQPVWPMGFLPQLKMGQEVLIVEGPFSAMRWASFLLSLGKDATGLPVALALFGAKCNQRIIDALQPFRPIFAYDDDGAGRNARINMRSRFPLAEFITTEKSIDDQTYNELEETALRITGLL